MRLDVYESIQSADLVNPDLDTGILLFLRALLLARLGTGYRAAEGERNRFGLDDAVIRMVARGEPAATFAGAAGRRLPALFFTQEELGKTLREREFADPGRTVDQQGVRQPVELAGQLVPSVVLKVINKLFQSDKMYFSTSALTSHGACDPSMIRTLPGSAAARAR